MKADKQKETQWVLQHTLTADKLQTLISNKLKRAREQQQHLRKRDKRADYCVKS